MTRPLETRGSRLARLTSAELDVLVVGGGITGIGVALEVAARGKSVGLLERGDWAGATSSASSRLIHGGLRYLEQYDFDLVRESCLERARLLDNGAGFVWPERFAFPLFRSSRVGRAKLLAGLALYTLVSLPKPLGVPRLARRSTIAEAIPGIDERELVGGGLYLDGATDDARLAIAVLATAVERGAAAVSRIELVGLERGAVQHVARLRDVETGAEHTARARAVVLAGGPFADELRSTAGLHGRPWVQPTRGSHVVVPRERLPTDGAVIFDSAVDGRVMFLIPWPRYTVIGTTDIDASATDAVAATRAEVHYLLDSANALVPAARLAEPDVVSTWAGLRPLLRADDLGPSARSREERVESEERIYTIAGGKLTGYRSMAEGLVDRIAREQIWNAPRHVTRNLRLRGALPARLGVRPWSRYADDPRDDRSIAWERRYAGLADEVDRHCGQQPRGQEPLDRETLEGEVLWAANFEDCRSTADFLLRRTDIGYGPREIAERAIPRIREQLAARLGWNEARAERDREDALAALQRLHAWKSNL
ncbi:MAG: glycerol-3-phosphate dehydrogenase/oxidase [Planctomycetota bacterium]